LIPSGLLFRPIADRSSMFASCWLLAWLTLEPWILR
jgi:hypothetical protein